MAREALATGHVTECSLDHDLGLHDTYVPDPAEDIEGYLNAVCRRGHGAETGLDLVEWMVATKNVPPKVRIHSWNPAGAQHMARLLNDFGYNVEIRPYDLRMSNA